MDYLCILSSEHEFTSAMDSKGDYHTILNTLPLSEKYLVSRSALERSGGWAMDNKDSVASDAKPVSPPGSDDTCSIDFDSPPRSVIVPKSRQWGSAESGLHLLGTSRSSNQGQGHERRSEERSTGYDCTTGNSGTPAPGTPQRNSDSRQRVTGSQSERKPSRPPIIPIWRPISTENILSKVRELLGDQAARAKVTGIVEAQKAAKGRSGEPKRPQPLKASHSSSSLDRRRRQLNDMSLEAQVSYNLHLKNHPSETDATEGVKAARVPDIGLHGYTNSDGFDDQSHMEENQWSKGKYSHHLYTDESVE